jgi:transposase-like protein
MLDEVVQLIEEHGNVSAAARASGIPEKTLYYRFQKAKETYGGAFMSMSHPNARLPFTAAPLPEKARSIDELIKHRREESKRARAYESARKLIPIELHTDGPVGFHIFGDPHIDNPGSDFELLEEHLKIAAARPEYIFAGNIGDVRDNWVGRLGRLFIDTTVNSKEIWRLVEWMMRGAGVRWTWLTRGNHDDWAGENDPLDWICRGGVVGVDRSAGLRIGFKHPNGRETRAHFRHDFPGHSMHNPLHALKRETLHGYRDHILAAGHRHEGADARDVTGDGLVFTMVRVSGYKVSDSYAHTLGLHKRPLHPSALVVVDPDEPDESPNRVWCAPSVEEGADYLDFKRKRFNTRRRK